MKNASMKYDSYDRNITYSKYLAIKERVEVINGAVYAMSSPKMWHQRVSKRIMAQLETRLRAKSCEAFNAPFDIRLFYREDGADTTVVQPDIFIVCDPAKLTNDFVKGSPDFILEILSDSTRAKDMVEKLNLYARAGVHEYWILDPESMVLITCILGKDGYYDQQNVFAQGTIGLTTLPLAIDFDDVFDGQEKPDINLSSL
jgi:Uma2 family endonuclease